jgi:capsid assembly protease
MKTDAYTPLTALALAIDVCWAIEPNWGMRAKRILDGIDYGTHLAEVVARTPKRRRAARADDPLNDDGDDDGPDFLPDQEEEQKRYAVTQGVATIFITGPMTKRPQSWGRGTATVLLRRAIRQAANDTEVGAILLVFDSPGGQVAGTADLADDIATASARKPVAAYIEDLGCSAAYWAACAAGIGLWCNAGANVGSCGAIMVLEDTSKQARMMGIDVHVYASGDRKGIGADGVPITKEHDEYLQAFIEKVGAQFTDAVQRSRKLSDKQMAEIRRAGLYVGEEAVKAGLVDGIKSRDAVQALLVKEIARRKGAGAAPALPSGATRVSESVRGSAEEITATGEGSEEEPAPSPAPEPVEAPESDALLESKLESAPQNVARSGELPSMEGEERAATLPSSRKTQPDPSGLPPAQAGRGERIMEVQVSLKEKFIRALNTFKLPHMAVAVVGAEENPDALVAAMSTKIEDEVQDRVNKDPLVMSCQAAGVRTPQDMALLLDRAKMGDDWLNELKSEAKQQAIRAFGTEQGLVIAASVANLDAKNVKLMRDSWSAQADAKFDIGANGEAAQRKTAPAAQPEALNATGEKDSKTAKSKWAQLNPDQQALAKKMGKTTPEAQEEFAGAYLGATNNA